MNKEKKILAEEMDEIITKAAMEVVAGLHGKGDDNVLMHQTLILGVGSRLVKVTVSMADELLKLEESTKEMRELVIKLRNLHLQDLKKYIDNVLSA